MMSLPFCTCASCISTGLPNLQRCLDHFITYMTLAVHVYETAHAQAVLDAMIKESIERRSQREKIMAERTRIEETRRGRAVALLQAGARGYLTRKKVTPQLVALREKKRLERERVKERVKTQAAITLSLIHI